MSMNFAQGIAIGTLPLLAKNEYLTEDQSIIHNEVSEHITKTKDRRKPIYYVDENGNIKRLTKMILVSSLSFFLPLPTYLYGSGYILTTQSTY